MKPIYLITFLLGAIYANAQPNIRRPDTKDLKQVVNKPMANNTSNNTVATKTTVPTTEPAGPAKGQIKIFWKHIDKMQNHTKEDNMQVVYSSGIQNAQMSLANVQLKDPNYNITEMEKALNECRAVYNKLDNARYSKRETRIETVNKTQILFDKPFIFKDAEINIGGNDVNNKDVIQNAIKISDATLVEYAKQVDAFIASNPEKAMYQNDQKTVAIIASGCDNDIKQVADEYKKGRSLANVSVLQKLFIYKTFIESVKKVFPEEGSLNTHLGKVNAAIATYGNRDKFIAKLESNQVEYIKNLRMAKAVTSNPNLEKTAKQQFEAAKMSNRNYTVTKVNIVSDWKLTKNEFDLPLYKELYINIAIKYADGKCGIAVAWMRQEYEGGGSYSNARLTMPGNIQELPCENLK